MRLRTLLIAMTATMVIVSVLCAQAVQVWRERESAREEEREQLALSVAAVTGVVATWMSEHTSAMVMLKGELEAEPQWSRETAAPILERHLAAQRDGITCVVVGVDGFGFAGAPAIRPDGRPVAGMDYRDRDYWKAIVEQRRTEPFYMPVLLTRSTHERGSGVALPLVRDGELFGTVVCAVRVTQLEQAAGRLSAVHSDLRLYVVDSNDHVVLGENAGGVHELVSVAGDPILATDARPNGRAQTRDGEWELVDRQTVPFGDQAWTVIAVVPDVSVIDAFVQASEGTLRLLVPLMLIVVFFAIVFVRRLTEPFEAIREQMARMASGDLRAQDAEWQGLVHHRYLPLEVSALLTSVEKSRASLSQTVERIHQVERAVQGALASVQGAVREIHGGLAESQRLAEGLEGRTVRTQHAFVAFSSVVERLSEVAARAVAHGGTMSAQHAALYAEAREIATSFGQVYSHVQTLAQTLERASTTVTTGTEAARRASQLMTALSAGVLEVEHLAQSVHLAAKEAEVDASEGLSVVASTERRIEDVRHSSAALARSIAQYNEQSFAISNVVSKIEYLAEEARLLSLNAAILASQNERDGDSFSVVADEMKRLALAIASASKEVTATLVSIEHDTAQVQHVLQAEQSTVAEAVDLAGLSRDALVKIAASSQRGLDAAVSIANQSSGHGEAITRVQAAIEDNVRITAQTALVVSASVREMVDTNKETQRFSSWFAAVEAQVRSQSTSQAEMQKHLQSLNVVGDSTVAFRDAQKREADALDELARQLKQNTTAGNAALAELERTCAVLLAQTRALQMTIAKLQVD